MFHGINELKNKVYPPNRPAALEAARRKRLSDAERHRAVVDTGSSDADEKRAPIADESRATDRGDGTMAA